MAQPFIQLKIRGVKEWREKLKTIPKRTAKEIAVALEVSGRRIKRAAQEFAPVGATSELRDTIALDLRPLEASIFSPQHYAPAVEFGLRAGEQFPTFDERSSLRVWVRRVLGVDSAAVTFLVARKIKERGTTAQPFLEKAVRTNQNFVEQQFGEALRRLASGLRE